MKTRLGVYIFVGVLLLFAAPFLLKTARAAGDWRDVGQNCAWPSPPAIDPQCGLVTILCQSGWNFSCSGLTTDDCGQGLFCTYQSDCTCTPPCDPNKGNSCNVNACGQAGGTIQCDSSCSGPTPGLPAGYGNSCNVNACGQAGGTIQCDSSCSGLTPGLPAGYGNSCSNSCGNIGTIDCSGSCNAASCPVCVPNQGQSCNINACGQAGGTIGCSGSCSGPTPGLPAGYGNSCSNSCGNVGTIDCSGSCNAASCPVCVPNQGQSCNINACGQAGGTIGCSGSCSGSTPGLPAGYGNSCNINACGQAGGTIGCSGSCSGPTPGLPAGYGNSCTSAPNACGMTNPGTIACSGSCSASTPPNSLCPVACSNDAGCNDGNSCTSDSCQNPGTPSAFCINSVSGGTHSACSGSSCVSVANTASSCSSSCSTNSDCGGCVANAGQSCSNGNSCVTGETIQCGGSCGGGVPISGSHCGGVSCVPNTASACSPSCSGDPDCAAPYNQTTLAASPSSPTIATPVTLTATVNGTAVGTINYNFWWDCPAYANVANPTVAGASVACGSLVNGSANANGYKLDAQSATSLSAPGNVYSSAGTHTPIVVIERGSAPPAEGQMGFTVNTVGATVTSVTVVCNPTAVNPNGTSICTATVNGTGNPSQTVTWSTNLGSVTSGGSYTAPGSTGTATVTATSQQDSSKSGTATIQVNGSVSVTINPLNVSLGPNGTQQFTAAVTGSADTTVDWMIDGIIGGDAAHGFITAGGSYTAPSPLPALFSSVFVTARSHADNSKMDTATVTFIAPPDCSIFSANPASIVLPQTSTLSWTCSGVNTCSIDHGIGGVGTVGSTQVSPTASSTTYTITCSGSGGSTSKSTTVTVHKPDVIEVTP
jgi:hypothetical protein